MVVGVCSNCLNYLIYFLALSNGLSILVASFAGYLSGMICSFYFGKKWVFKQLGRTSAMGIFIFAVIYASGGIGMIAIVYVLSNIAHLDYQTSWLFGAAFAAINNFLGSKWLVFSNEQNMTTKYGILSRLEFLQNWASLLIVSIKDEVMHNIEKYYALKKVFYLSGIEDLEGDYLEFGVFKGSSFCHAIRCCRNISRAKPDALKTRFFGFDSFAGFGTLDDNDKHSVYTDENFICILPNVESRVGRAAGSTKYMLVPGFFRDSLSAGANFYGIEKSRIIFIDCDTYSSSREALTFCQPTVQLGTFIILDDYFSFCGSMDLGVARAFNEFVEQCNLKVRHVFAYGMGGAVYIISGKVE
jgi:O-methyltransferase